MLRLKDKKSYQLNPSIDRLTLRLVLPEEQERFNDLLKQHHYLHSAGSAGETLRYVAQIDGQWMGALVGGRILPAEGSRRMDRVGRGATACTIETQNRRLILPWVDLANLASKTLGMCLRVLADHWQEAFGYRPLVAETFVDPQIHRGTCYEASGWTPLGLSAGYGRQREDFYQRHERPKQIWVKPLKANALELLRASGPLPAAQSQALNETDNSHAVCLKVEQMSSLWERFNQIEDFRRKAGLRYRLATVLSMIVLGTTYAPGIQFAGVMCIQNGKTLKGRRPRTDHGQAVTPLIKKKQGRIQRKNTLSWKAWPDRQIATRFHRFAIIQMKLNLPKIDPADSSRKFATIARSITPRVLRAP